MRFVVYHGRMEGMEAAEVTRRALQWLDQRPDRPFFLFLNYMDMHVPYLPPYEQAARFSATPRKIARQEKFGWRPRGEVSEAEKKRLANEAYDASLAYLDSQLRVLWEGIERRGLDRNLLVIITSDHGESLGEHGIYEHFNSLYLEQIRVPLFIHFAGKVPAGVKATGIVSLHQMAATVLSLAGIPPDRWMGPSMEAQWTGTQQEGPPVFAEIPTSKDFPGVIETDPVAQGWVKALTTSEWHFVLQEHGKVELYRWKTDPEELQNLAGDVENQKLVERFRSLLQATADAKRAAAGGDSVSYPKN